MQTVSAKKPGPYKVYLGLVSTAYIHSEGLAQTIADGIAFCRLSDRIQQSQRMLIKVDAPYAHAVYAKHSYVHPEFLHQALKTIQQQNRKRSNLKMLVETNRWFDFNKVLTQATGQHARFAHKGYFELERLLANSIKIIDENQSPQCEYLLSKRNAHSVKAAQLYSDQDFLVFISKLKSSILSDGIQGALRLNSVNFDEQIDGNQTLIDRLEVACPDLVISDGIITGVRSHELTARGHELGVVLVANNIVAHDVVFAEIMNQKVVDIEHLSMAIKEHWGPATLDLIEIGGAKREMIELLQQKTKVWDLGLISLTDLNKTTPLVFHQNLNGPNKIISKKMLSWFFWMYDTNYFKNSIKHWPAAEVFLGAVKIYPRLAVVYLLGQEAIQSFELLESTVLRQLTIVGLTLKKVQLKNTKIHWVVALPDRQCNRMGLTLAFTLGSWGRMTYRVWFSAFFNSLKRYLGVGLRRLKRQPKIKLQASYLLRNNQWWR